MKLAFDIFNKNNTDNIYNSSIDQKLMDKILSSNLIVSNKSDDWYTNFNRFGFIDPTNIITGAREYLFFTKPDLNIFTGSKYDELKLNSDIAHYPIFNTAFERYKNVLSQLQYSVRDKTNTKNPFMCLLSNAVTSTLDLPGITADNTESSQTIYGTTIAYRGHSLKSDNGYDFTLSFTDSRYLEVYMLAKLYDEYMRLIKIGVAAPKQEYIINRIIPEQFSIYKFITADDGETIIVSAKITGVSMMDVPRSDIADIPTDGNIKFSLSFHGQFVEDMSTVIYSDFNKVTIGNPNGPFVNAYNKDTGHVNNEWAKYPVIVEASSNKRAANGLGNKEYKLKWTNTKK